MVGSWLVLPPGAMFGSMALQHQGSVTTKGQVDVSGLGCHLGTCLGLRAVQNWPHPHQLQYSGERAPHSAGLEGEPDPKDVRVGELALPFIFHPHTPFTTCGRWET